MRSTRAWRAAVGVLFAGWVLAGGLRAADDKPQPAVFTHGPWRAVVSGAHLAISAGGTDVLSGFYPGLKVGSAEPAETGGFRFRLAGADTPEAPVVLTVREEGGRLVLRSDPAGGKGWPLLVSFSGGDLAGTDVLMDGKPVRIPDAFVTHEFQHARQYRFFPALPGKTLGLEFKVCDFTNLRDFRKDGRTDLQIFALPGAGGVVEAVFDLTLAAAVTQSEGYEGQRYVAADDLHLPDLSQSPNLVQNPSFEGGLSLWSWGVTDIREAPDKRGGWALDSASGLSGRKSACYTVAKGFNPPMLCTFPIAVKTGATYTASFSVKSDRPDAGFSLFVHTATWGAFPASQRYKAGPDWQRFTVTFKAPNPFLRLCFGDRWWDQQAQDQVDGARIWLDDVQLKAGDKATDFVQKPVYAWSVTPVRNNAFLTGAAPTVVTVTTVNTTPAPVAVTTEVRIEDIYRKTLLRQEETSNLEPWAEAAIPVDLAGVGRSGLLRVVMTCRTAGDRSETFYGRAALCERIAGPVKVCYADHQSPSVEEAQYLKPFGITGSLSFYPPEDPALCKQLEDLGWTHVFTAAHARDCPVKVFHQAMTDADWDVYDQWLGARIAPLKDQEFWKTLNEPNCGGYTWTPAECARAVALIRKHVKAANPAAKVLTPDPYNASRGGQMWIEEFFKAGGDKLVDVLAIHTYRARPEAPDLDEDIRSLVALKERYGLGQAPIMFTEGEGTASYQISEIGMSPFRGFFEWRLGLLGLDVGRAELASAALMTRTLLACFKNSAHVKYYLTWSPDFVAGQPRATLCAINRLYALLGNAEFATEHVIGNTSKTYVFTTPAEVPVAVLWCHDLKVDRGEAPAPEVTLPLAGPEWRFLDMMGNPAAVTADAGKSRFELSGLPVYIVGPAAGLGMMNQALEQATIGKEGLRPVDLSFRLKGAGLASLNVANRLLRTVKGAASVSADDGAAGKAEVLLGAKESAATDILLGAEGPGFTSTRLQAVFQEDNVPTVTTKEDDLRWFGIPRLKTPVVIDGDAADWANVPGRVLDSKDAVLSWAKDQPWAGPRDLSATCRFAYDDDGLYLCIEVVDDTYSQTNPVGTVWRGDSIQLYIDLLADGHDRPGTGYDSNDQTIWIAKIGDKDTLYRDYTPEWQVAFVNAGLITRGACAVKRGEGRTVYEVRLDKAELFPLRMQPGTTFGLGLLINDADADGTRKQALTNTRPGTEPHQLPELWPHAILVGE